MIINDQDFLAIARRTCLCFPRLRTVSLALVLDTFRTEFTQRRSTEVVFVKIRKRPIRTVGAEMPNIRVVFPAVRIRCHWPPICKCRSGGFGNACPEISAAGHFTWPFVKGVSACNDQATPEQGSVMLSS